MEGLRGTAIANGRGPPARGMRSPARAAFGAPGGPVGDGSSQRPGLISWGDGDAFQGGGGCSWRAYEGRQCPTARVYQLAGCRVPPRRRSVLMKGLYCTAVCNSLGSPARGTRSPTQATVNAHGVPAGNGSSQQPGLTSQGGRGVLPRHRWVLKKGL